MTAALKLTDADSFAVQCIRYAVLMRPLRTLPGSAEVHMPNNDLIPCHLAPHAGAFEQKTEMPLFALPSLSRVCSMGKAGRIHRLFSTEDDSYGGRTRTIVALRSVAPKTGPDHTSGPSIHDCLSGAPRSPDATLRLATCYYGVSGASDTAR
jgi:hypothetical protein